MEFFQDYAGMQTMQNCLYSSHTRETRTQVFGHYNMSLSNL